MKKWICLGGLMVLVACDVQQSPVVTGPDGQLQIQINTNGLTCYQTRCLDISPAARSVRSVGTRTIGIPGSINVSDGTITPAEFQQLATATLLAGGTGSRGDR